MAMTGIAHFTFQLKSQQMPFWLPIDWQKLDTSRGSLGRSPSITMPLYTVSMVNDFSDIRRRMDLEFLCMGAPL